MLRSSRLDRALTKLAAPGTGPSGAGREIGAGAATVADLVAAVLTEIDETMLARRLTFRVRLADGTAREFACDAYGRRLVALVPPLPEGAPGEMAGAALEALDAAGRGALRGTFEALVAGAQGLRVSAQPLPEARDAARLGLGAEALAQDWGLELGGDMPPAPTEALERMIAAGGDGSGWLRLAAGGETAAAGPAEALERLRAFAADGLAAFRAGEGDPGDEPRCTVVGRQDGDGPLLVLAEAGGECLLMLAPPSELAGLIGAWRSVFR